MDRSHRRIDRLFCLLWVGACNEAADPSFEPSPDEAGSSDGGDSDADSGGSDDAVQPSDGPAWLEIGRGETAFEALPVDGSVVVQLGPQGSWMTFLALRGNGFPPLETRLLCVATLGREQVGNLQQRSDFVFVDGNFEAVGLALLFDPDVNMQNMLGQDLALEVTLTDSDGGSLTVSATLTPTMSL